MVGIQLGPNNDPLLPFGSQVHINLQPALDRRHLSPICSVVGMDPAGSEMNIICSSAPFAGTVLKYTVVNAPNPLLSMGPIIRTLIA